MLNSYASAPPFASYTRSRQETFSPDHQSADSDLNAALAASLREHQQYQQQQQHQQRQQRQQHQQQQQQQRAGPRSRGAIQMEAVSGAVQVPIFCCLSATELLCVKMLCSFFQIW